MKEMLNPHIEGPMKFMIASIITQIISLGAFYPFDVIKVWMQTSNHIYKYQNVFTAYWNILSKQGIFQLYHGLNYYLTAYVMSVSLSLTCHEIILGFLKRKGQFAENEMACITFSSVLSAIISSSLTNPFETITVNKQLHPSLNIIEFIKSEKYWLLTKGIVPWVLFNSIFYIIFFNVSYLFGKLFDVTLTDT